MKRVIAALLLVLVLAAPVAAICPAQWNWTNITCLRTANWLDAVSNLTNLRNQVQNISLTPGPPGPMNQTFNLTANMTAGPTGPKGDTGSTGSKGDMGSTGPIGPANMTANMTAGPVGPMNLTANMTAGPTGPTGPINLTANMTAGPAGSAATIGVNYTFTVASGTPASVTNIGSSAAALFNFFIPQGIQGLTGPAGPMNQTINLTANMTAGPMGPMNLTANMTAGPVGPMNQTFNLTANMTAGPTSANALFSALASTANGNIMVWNGTGARWANDSGYTIATLIAAVPIINNSYDTIANQSTWMNTKETIANTSTQLNLKETIANTSTQLNLKETIANTSTQLNLKLALAGGTMTGNIAMGAKAITGLVSTSDMTSAVNRTYTGTHGATTASNSAPAITHSLGATPTGCLVTPSLTNTSVDVVGLTSTTFLINGTKTGTTTYTAMTSQTIYWECWV